MFGFSVIRTDELNRLLTIAGRWRRAEAHSWWPNQAFVCRFLRRIVEGEQDMWSIRQQFDKDLAEYIAKEGKGVEPSISISPSFYEEKNV